MKVAVVIGGLVLGYVAGGLEQYMLASVGLVAASGAVIWAVYRD